MRIDAKGERKDSRKGKKERRWRAETFGIL